MAPASSNSASSRRHGTRRVEPVFRGNAEQALGGVFRAAFAVEIGDGLEAVFGQADDRGALRHLERGEDRCAFRAASAVGARQHGAGAVGGDEERRIAYRPPDRVAPVAAVAEQMDADSRRVGERGPDFDLHRVGVGRRGSGAERGGDLAVRDRAVRHGAVGDEFGPCHLVEALKVEGRPGEFDTARPGDEPGGAQKRVGEQHRRDGDPRDAVYLPSAGGGSLAQRSVERHLDAVARVVIVELVEIDAEIVVVASQRGDRLDMPGERDAGQPAFQVDGGEDVEGLARIADGLHGVPRIESVADDFVAAV